MATSPRIAQMIGKNNNLTGNILIYLWNQGYIKRMPVKTPGNKTAQAQGCTWYYAMTKKGERNYRNLLIMFGDQQINAFQQSEEPEQPEPQQTPPVFCARERKVIICPDCTCSLYRDCNPRRRNC